MYGRDGCRKISRRIGRREPHLGGTIIRNNQPIFIIIKQDESYNVYFPRGRIGQRLSIPDLQLYSEIVAYPHISNGNICSKSYRLLADWDFCPPIFLRIDNSLKYLLITGLCGGYTTFSTFFLPRIIPCGKALITVFWLYTFC